MAHDEAPWITFAGVIATAIATVLVAWISTRAGKKAHAKQDPFQPSESGEHAHTRDVMKAGFRGLHDKLDALLLGRGLQRQQEQVAESSRRILGEQEGDG